MGRVESLLSTLPIGLVSFLNRVDMKREGSTITLTKKY
jgi:hypothetical protein